MTVLVQTVPGLTRQQYEDIAGALGDKLMGTPGFQAHYAFESEDGMIVVEIWETASQHDAWFDNNVRPHLPAEATPEKHELANKMTA
jgi:heme-degrading monooxygenase HmoA